MGCACTKSLQQVDQGTARIRAGSTVETYGNLAGLTSVAFLQATGSQQSVAPVRRHSRNRSSNAASDTGSNSTGLSRSQWKQVRSLLRSNTNPHYHQIQQLQVLPAARLQQPASEAAQREQQRLPPGARSVLPDATVAASAAAVNANSQLLHHQHHHSSSSRHRPHEQLLVQQLSAGAGLAGFSSSSNTLTARQLASVQSAPATVGPTAAPALQSHHSSSSHSSSKSVPASAAAADALSAGQVLALCGAVVEEDSALAAAGISPLLLASLCMIESGGCPHAKQYREHLDDIALGLCQMLLSTAQWLAGTKGFTRYGTWPTAADLQQPKTCLYYAAAYLTNLAHHNGSRRGEAFIVKAYHAGPKGVNSAAATQYWQKYAKARHYMRQVARCMADTLAAAAASAGLPLVLHAGTPSSCLLSSAVPESTQQQPQERREGSDSSSSPQQQQDEELKVWMRAANLIAALSSSWEPGAAAAAVQGPSAASAAEAAAASSAASLMLHIFPHWSSLSKDYQQQQQQVAGSSGSGTGVGLLRRWRSGGSAAAAAAGSSSDAGAQGSRAAAGSSSSIISATPAFVAPTLAAAACSDGALAMAPVSRAAFAAALQRLACIDHAATETALSNAAACAAAAAASAAAEERRRARQDNPSNSSSSSEAVGAGSSSSVLLQALPCVMHVVGHGESLASIAAVCGVAIPDIVAANPDLPAANIMPNVQANDCIALPVPAIPPRLHVVQHGDTLQSIARMYRVPLGRLLAKNPELADPLRVQQGWVVALPGLKGDSKSGAAMEWLAEAAVAAAAPFEVVGVGDASAPAAAMHRVGGVLAGGQLLSSKQQVQDADRRQLTRQDQAAAPPAAAAAAAASVDMRSSSDDLRSNSDDLRSSNDDTAPAGLDINGGSPISTWAHVGWQKSAASSAAAKCAAEPAAAQLLPSVGSGAFMFAVGQASETGVAHVPGMQQ